MTGLRLQREGKGAKSKVDKCNKADNGWDTEKVIYSMLTEAGLLFPIQISIFKSTAASTS